MKANLTTAVAVKKECAEDGDKKIEKYRGESKMSNT